MSALLWGACLLATGCPSSEECVPPMPTAADLQDRVFDRCAFSSSCHSREGTKASLDLSSIEATCADLLDTPACEKPSVMRVVAGSPEDSYLYQKLVCADFDCTAELGPSDPDCPDGEPSNVRMPYNNPPLPQCQIDVIAQWITEGLPGCEQARQ